MIIVSLLVFLGGAAVFAAASFLEWSNARDVIKEIVNAIQAQFPNLTLTRDLVTILFVVGSVVAFLGLFGIVAAATAKPFLLISYGVLYGLAVLANTGYFIYGIVQTAQKIKLNFIAGYITLNCLVLFVEFAAVASAFWVAALVKERQREIYYEQAKSTRKEEIANDENFEMQDKHALPNNNVYYMNQSLNFKTLIFY
jgi:hypothetical protein